MQAYSDPSRASDPHALPDVEVFELTADEVVALPDWEDVVHEYTRMHEYRLAAMNSRVRQQMIDAIIEQHNIEGGWFYWFCFPGCMPDSDPIGPFATRELALADAQEGV